MSIHRVCHENSISAFPSSGYAPLRDILSIASIIPANTDCFPNRRYNHQSPSHLISHAHHLHVSPARNPPIAPVFLHAAHCYRTYRTRRTCRPHAPPKWFPWDRAAAEITPYGCLIVLGWSPPCQFQTPCRTHRPAPVCSFGVGARQGG